MLKRSDLKNSGIHFPLFVIGCLLLFVCCGKNKNELVDITPMVADVDIASPIKDSINIEVHMTAKSAVGFNIKNQYLRSSFLDFVNRSPKDSILTKTISRKFNDQIILFEMAIYKDGVYKHNKHYYLIDSKTNDLRFKYKKGDLILLNDNPNICVDELYNKYDSIRYKFRTEGKNDVKRLEELFYSYDKKYTLEKNDLLIKLNKDHYMDVLQEMLTNDDKIEPYLENVKNPVASNIFYNTLYNYIKNNILELNFDKITTENFSKEYLKFLSIGVFNFLRHEDNKGDKQYQFAIDWLKTTNLYQKNSAFIDKEIAPLNNKAFVEKINKIIVSDITGKNFTLREVLKKNPSNYYLIDFWATWCAPCIEGINLMKGMDIPKNVSIISLSLDKTKDLDKWRKMTQKFKQKISYVLENDELSNQSFLKFLKIESIPRYVIIDKNMNLIDEAFYHPSEPQFLPKLKNVKRSKYW